MVGNSDKLSPSFLPLNRTLSGIKHGSTPYLDKKEDNLQRRRGGEGGKWKHRKYNPDRLCTMDYDTGLYSGDCEEKKKRDII